MPQFREFWAASLFKFRGTKEPQGDRGTGPPSLFSMTLLFSSNRGYLSFSSDTLPLRSFSRLFIWRNFVRGISSERFGTTTEGGTGPYRVPACSQNRRLRKQAGIYSLASGNVYRRRHFRCAAKKYSLAYGMYVNVFFFVTVSQGFLTPL